MGGPRLRLIVPVVLFLSLLQAPGEATHMFGDCGAMGDAPNAPNNPPTVPPGNCNGAVWASHSDAADYYRVFAEVGQRIDLASSSRNIQVCLYMPTVTHCGSNGQLSCPCRASVGDLAPHDGYFVFSVAETVRITYQETYYSLSVTVDGARNERPVMEALHCSPQTIWEGAAVTCTMRARDDSAGLRYHVQWRPEESYQVLPETGSPPATPGIDFVVSRVYNVPGQHTITVVAVDEVQYPTPSNALTFVVVVKENKAPKLTPVVCSPNPITPWSATTCRLNSTDDQPGVWYSVDFGDGAPPVRVPESGSMSPGVATTASHAYRQFGTYTVRTTVTDTAPIPKSAVGTTAVTVRANQAPVLQTFQCTTPAWQDRAVTCILGVADDSGGVYVQLDWGDGTLQRLPASGTVPPGQPLVATRVLTAGTYALRAVASDDNVTAPLSSPQSSLQLVVHAEQVVTGTLVAGGGLAARGAPLTRGIDHAEIALVATSGGTERGTLTWYGQPGAADLDLVFLAANGAAMPSTGCGQARVGTSETCLAPAGAVTARIHALGGANIQYTFRYGPG